MRVYRITDQAGEGVFTSGLVSAARQRVAAHRGVQWFDDLADELDPNRHPGPSDCPRLQNLGIHQGSDWRFGFLAMPQLLRWFDSEAIRVQLADLGAVVRVYETDPLTTVSTGQQAVFLLATATLVDELAVPTLAA